jgi:sigma-B regulation protein RsbU (phosphoserine phosphatase)
VIRGDSELIRLEDGGPVIGLLKTAVYRAQTVQLAYGDVLFAYTDGISEAMTLEDEEWGEDRMLAAVQDLDLPADEMLHSVFEAADRFTSGAPQHDDMTVLLMKLH